MSCVGCGSNAISPYAIVTIKSHPKSHAARPSCSHQSRIFVGTPFRVVTTNIEAWLLQLALAVFFTEPAEWNATQAPSQKHELKKRSKLQKFPYSKFHLMLHPQSFRACCSRTKLESSPACTRLHARSPGQEELQPSQKEDMMHFRAVQGGDLGRARCDKASHRGIQTDSSCRPLALYPECAAVCVWV
jgi:hypothetical protein